MGTMISNILLCTSITVMSYAVGNKVFKTYNKSWLNPLYTVTVFIIGLLTLSHIQVAQYSSGTGIFSLLLGTATVSLAVPLYRHVRIIRKNFVIIFWAVMPGTLTGVISIVLLTKYLHMNKEIMLSLIPKSVTAPIALSVSQSLGGIPSLTILFVCISAVFSLMVGPFLLNFTRIRSRIAKGLALGTSAQAIGANRAFEWGEIEGVMGSIAMITSALIMSIMIPLLLQLSLS
jgi:putative effector of murein hydrolase